MVPLHSTAQIGLEQYIQRRRPFAPFDDHVFVSLRRRSLLVGDAETAFRTAAMKIGLMREPGLPRPTIPLSFAATPSQSEPWRTARTAEIGSRNT